MESISDEGPGNIVVVPHRCKNPRRRIPITIGPQVINVLNVGKVTVGEQRIHQLTKRIHIQFRQRHALADKIDRVGTFTGNFIIKIGFVDIMAENKV